MVRVVLHGRILVQSYAQSISQPEIIATLVGGDVFGYDQIDNGISNDYQNWMIACSNYHTTHVLVIERNYFEFIWDQQKNSKSYLLKQILDTHPIFQGVSDKTLYLLAFELIQFR